MKKILCMMSLLLISMVAMAVTETKAFVPPENDIGYEQTMCATISLDGLTFSVVNNEIVGWQAPVTLSMESIKSAQVVDAYTVATPMGEVSMTLVCFRWPTANSQMNDATLHNNQSLRADLYDSFRHSRTDYI